MKTSVVKIESIVFPSKEFELRSAPTEKDKDYAYFQELKENIKRIGLIKPICCISEGDHYVVEDGMRRLSAIRQLIAEGCSGKDDEFKDGMITIVLRTDEEYDRLTTSIAANYHNKKTMNSQNIKALMRIQIATRCSLQQLSAKVGMSESYLANLLKLDSLPVTVKELIDEEKLTLTNAIQLNKLSDDEIESESWLKDALSLNGEDFTIKVSQHLKKKAKEKRDASAGKPKTYTPVSSLKKKQDLEIMLEQSKAAYEFEATDFNRGFYEAMLCIFELDEKTLAEKRAQWEADEQKHEEEKDRRKQERDAARTAEVLDSLTSKGYKITAPEGASEEAV
jgi:ParB-like chromosome segregation protein Spo0J